jgi:hypothetical protein
MSREPDGRFTKNSCGNPKGRPVETLTVPSLDEHRKGFLRNLYGKCEVTTKDGKKKRMRRREVIEGKLIGLAMQGDRQAIFKVLAIEEQIIAAKTNERVHMLSEIVKFERTLRENPDAVTKERLDALKLAYRQLEEADKLN